MSVTQGANDPARSEIAVLRKAEPWLATIMEEESLRFRSDRELFARELEGRGLGTSRIALEMTVRVCRRSIDRLGDRLWDALRRYTFAAGLPRSPSLGDQLRRTIETQLSKALSGYRSIVRDTGRTISGRGRLESLVAILDAAHDRSVERIGSQIDVFVLELEAAGETGAPTQPRGF